MRKSIYFAAVAALAATMGIQTPASATNHPTSAMARPTAELSALIAMPASLTEKAQRNPDVLLGQAVPDLCKTADLLAPEVCGTLDYVIDSLS